MSTPAISEVKWLSLWDISHYWHGFNPQRTSSYLPLEVQKTLRALALRASKGMYLRCNAGGIIFNSLTDHDFEPAIALIRRFYLREFNFAITGRKYKRKFLSQITMSKNGLILWCRLNSIEPPKFWFGDDDPLLKKSIDQLECKISPEQMLSYGFVRLLSDPDEKPIIEGIKLSTDFDKVDKPVSESKDLIKEALSQMNRANAEVRYSKLNQLKSRFETYYADNMCEQTTKADRVREFFDTLTFDEKITIVPSFEEKSPKENYRKAIRNLSKAVKK